MAREEEGTKAAFAEAYRKLQSGNPDDRITVKDIAETAGYDRHTFYYHFTGFYDLISWIFDTEIAAITEQAAGDWRSVVRSLVGYADANRRLVLSLHHSPKNEETTRFLERKMNALLFYFLSSSPSFSASGEERRRRIAVFIAGGALSLFYMWLDSGMERSPADISAELLDSIERGLAGFQSM